VNLSSITIPENMQCFLLGENFLYLTEIRRISYEVIKKDLAKKNLLKNYEICLQDGKEIKLLMTLNIKVYITVIGCS